MLEEVLSRAAAVLRPAARGRYAVAAAGSIGRGVAGSGSDIDLRLYYDERAEAEVFDRAMADFRSLTEEVAGEGFILDDVWPRRITEVERHLREWAAGTAAPFPLVWTTWGYHLPADVGSLHVIDDPDGIVETFRSILFPYPAALKTALLDRHLAPLEYWTGDRHYRRKVTAGDTVFAVSLCVRLVHHCMQVLYALNERYYPGDGYNLELIEDAPLLPPDLRSRIVSILSPGDTTDPLESQYAEVTRLARDCIALTDPR